MTGRWAHWKHWGMGLGENGNRDQSTIGSVKFSELFSNHILTKLTDSRR